MKQYPRVGIGLVGSQFITSIHVEALRQVPGADIVAVVSPTPGNANRFAAKHGIAHHFTDLDAMLALDEIDMIVIGAPNLFHCDIAVRAARAGKHVVVEKPMCVTLAEADRMIAECARARVKLMYAEELCFAPKYVRLKQLLDQGMLGRPIQFRQSEKHDGPHADHFWDVERSGGGVTMDMGCHAFQFFRWLNGNNPVKSVYAQMSTNVHAAKTRGDDNAVIILEFENGVVGVAEESWTKLGGMDDTAEVHGTEGVAYADLLQGVSIPTYSTQGCRLRGREGRQHGRLELRDVRGGLELRLSAGVPAFRRLCPPRPATVDHGRRRQGRARDHLCGLRIGGCRQEDHAAVADHRVEAPRPVAAVIP